MSTPHLKLAGYALRCICGKVTPFFFLDEKKVCKCGKVLEVPEQSKKRFIHKFERLGHT